MPPSIDAARSHVIERNIALIRLTIVAVGALVYFFLLDHTGTDARLAGVVAGVALAFSAFVLGTEPYRRWPKVASSYTVSALDGAFLLVWIYATGGFASPFYVVMYVAIAAIAFRYSPVESLVASLLYAFSYVSMLLFLGEGQESLGELVLRISYIFLVAAVGILVSSELASTQRQTREMSSQVEQARLAVAKFRSFLETAPDGIVVADRGGRIVVANTRAERMFGFNRGELTGAPVDTVIPEVVQAEYREFERSTPPEGTLRMLGRGQEVVARRRDGSTFAADVNLSPVGTDEGLLITSIVRDVTDRREAERERARAEEQRKELVRLKELDDFKTRLINTTAHELGTPLTPIKLQVHLLKKGLTGPLNEEQEKAVGILDRNINRLTHLVEDVLEVARLQAGRLKVDQKALDINDVVGEAAESFEAPAREAGISLETKLAPQLHVHGDSKRLIQVLFNLLSNAIKFTPHGGKIRLETKLQDDQAMVTVQDTGAGIRRDDLARLFQPFSQVHDPMQRTHAGSGLGLYISRGIVELHGGRIWADSPGPDMGTTVTLTLPIITQVPVEIQPKKPEPRQEGRMARRARELI